MTLAILSALAEEQHGLVDAMHDQGRGTTDDEQDAVLRRVVGMDAAELGRRLAHP